jgi:hypothetical protein
MASLDAQVSQYAATPGDFWIVIAFFLQLNKIFPPPLDITTTHMHSSSQKNRSPPPPLLTSSPVPRHSQRQQRGYTRRVCMGKADGLSDLPTVQYTI